MIEHFRSQILDIINYFKIQIRVFYFFSFKDFCSFEHIEVLETPLLEGNGTYQERGKDKIQKVNQERLKSKKEQRKKGKVILNTEQDILKHINLNTDTESVIDDNIIVPATPQKKLTRVLYVKFPKLQEKLINKYLLS